MLKINKATVATLACNADIRFYMRSFNYCNNGGGWIAALDLAFDEWTSVKRMRCSKTAQNWRYISLQFCIPMIWNCFHRRPVDPLRNWQNAAAPPERRIYSCIIGRFVFVMANVWKIDAVAKVKSTTISPVREKNKKRSNQANRDGWHTVAGYFNVLITASHMNTPPRTHLPVVTILMSHINITVNKSTYLFYPASAPLHILSSLIRGFFSRSPLRW